MGEAADEGGEGPFESVGVQKEKRDGPIRRAVDAIPTRLAGVGADPPVVVVP